MALLDPSQVRAACAEGAVQLVLAGPGAGKTATLVGRFRHLHDSGVDPRRILAVTFTRKAADEMRGRIARDLALGSGTELRVFTFHGLALRCLQRNPHLAGLPDRVEVWAAHQQRQVFSSRRMYWNDEGDILDIIAGAKEQMLDAAHFRRGLAKDDEVGQRAAEFFAVYEVALREAGAIDFADMVPLLLKAVADHPAYGRSVAGAVDHLLVDEYQDINPGQHRLIEHFRSSGVKLWAVGDDDQTLFSFRSADVRYTLDFQRRHADALLHVLDRNYRSSPEIVAAAKRLIAKNRDRIVKDYAPARREEGAVVVRGYSTADVEVRQVCRAIALLIRDGRDPEAIAVLYRAGSTGLGFQAGLKALGIPFEVRGGGDLWQSAAAKLFLGALFYLVESGDPRAAERLGSGKRGETVRRRLDALPPHAVPDFMAACRHVRRVVSEALPKRAPEREQHDWANLCDAIGALAETCSGLDELMERIAEQSRALRTPTEGSVVLSTIHSAKGLEWDAVFVVGLEDGLMPSAGADLDEERRVAYVAATRAKRLLALTHAGQRGGKAALRSRFIAELAGDALRGTDAGHADGDALLPLGPPHGPDPATLPPIAPEPGGGTRSGTEPPSRRERGPGSRRDSGAKSEAKSDAKTAARTDAVRPVPYSPDPEAAAAQWTARDDARLQVSFATAELLDEICAATGKSEDAVVARLVRLKLVRSRSAARARWG